MNMFLVRNIVKPVFIAIGFLVTTTFTAHAAVTQSTGSGSAVSTINAVANFESMAALYGNPYVENGISFSRTGLTFNNNGCGYAGCYSLGLVGNYMYGSPSKNGAGGYFQIAAESGKLFQGLEFLVNSGFGNALVSFIWESSLNGSVISSGSGIVSPLTVLGFSDALGFDSFKYTESSFGITTFDTTYNAPAFDNVRVQYVVQAVPEPTTIALFSLGLLGFAASRRKSAQNKNA